MLTWCLAQQPQLGPNLVTLIPPILLAKLFGQRATCLSLESKLNGLRESVDKLEYCLSWLLLADFNKVLELIQTQSSLSLGKDAKEVFSL